jgi:phosphoserine phosphatase RsbU/P
MDQVKLPPGRSANAIRDAVFGKQLRARRQRLQAVLPSAPEKSRLEDLLREVDFALARMEAGTYGLCDTCHDPIEEDRLLADPLCRNCLDHLSPTEQRALEHDLDLAFQVQSGLLPKRGVTTDGWSMVYHYEPAGAVSGDYCDWISCGNGTAFFCIGDVAGKGVAASMLMAQLYAIFRSLAASTPSPCDLLARANRVFTEGIVSSHFATLVCGRLGAGGEVEICNAGHCFPFHVHRGEVTPIPSTGLPLGLFADADYETEKVTLEPGDTLVLYSDGLTESFNRDGQQYGAPRLTGLLERVGGLPLPQLLAALLEDVRGYRTGAPVADDLTMMALRRD